jgi:hypothetical protein
MAMKDEIRRERQAVMKHGTPKDKWNYFKDYYMLRTIVVVAVLVFAICFIYDTVTKPDIVLNGMFLNTFNFDERTDSAAELEEQFTKQRLIILLMQSINVVGVVRLVRLLR